ncbi:MAG: hypothetical protein IRZ11_07285, partial [Clostridia bacterium]|nr:hypothetical protein [Clostridia bacterium]
MHRGASLVLAADRKAGLLFETALTLGDGVPELDAWALQAALSARGIFATYDSCEAFLEKLVAIAAGEAPPATVETRVRELARASGGAAERAEDPAARALAETGSARAKRSARAGAGAARSPGAAEPAGEKPATAQPAGDGGRRRRRRRRPRRPRPRARRGRAPPPKPIAA